MVGIPPSVPPAAGGTDDHRCLIVWADVSEASFSSVGVYFLITPACSNLAFSGDFTLGTMSPSRLRTAVLGSTGRRPTTATLAGSASPADWCSGSAQAGRLCPLAHTRLQAGNARESRYRCETPASGFPRSQSPRNQRDDLVELNGDVLVLTAEHAQPSPSGLSPKGCCGVSMRTETAPRRV